VVVTVTQVEALVAQAAVVQVEQVVHLRVLLELQT
jgi:hypothetical protein